jgi:uncharacterized protein (DUF58 family)
MEPSARLAPIGTRKPADAGAWERLVRAVRLPRTLKITGVGRMYLVVTLGVGLGALNTGNNLLYLVLALLLSLVIVSGVLSERCLRGLQVRRLGTEAAFAQEPFAFRWALRRPTGHAFALELSEADAHVTGTGHLAHLPPGEEVVVRADLLAARRGPHVLSGIRVTTLYPFGLFAKTRELEAPGMLHVYPRRELSGAAGSHLPPTAEGALESRAGTGGTGEVLGLSPLREGDDARRIHWPRTASLGQVVRLDLAREERRTVTLRPTTEVPSEALERDCERLAGTLHHLIRSGHEVGFEGGDLVLRPAPGPAQELRILRALCGLGFEERGA